MGGVGGVGGVRMPGQPHDIRLPEAMQGAMKLDAAEQTAYMKVISCMRVLGQAMLRN
jgi:hypothetical protein